MEARLIFESNKAYLPKVGWLRPTDNSDSEWIHIGTGKKLDRKLIGGKIDTHIGSKLLFVCSTRTTSHQIDKNLFETQLNSLVDISDFTLWDEEFKRVIEFNHIGVLRLGIIP